MYGIQHKVYGIEVTDEFKDILANYFRASSVAKGCTGNCDDNVICDWCYWNLEGVHGLPDILGAFWTTYSGDNDFPVIFGVHMDEAAEFDSKELQKLFTDTSVSDLIKSEYNKMLREVPQDLLTAMNAAGLKPGIVFAHGTS